MSIPAETRNGDVTSWIPLADVFTPSAGCESIFRLNGPSLVAFDPGYGLDINPTVKCVPPAVTTWWEQARLGVGGDKHTAISIQPLVCPNEWTTVGTYTKDKTTQIMCCPSGYSNMRATSGPVNGDCVSQVSKGMVMTYASTNFMSPKDWKITTTTLSASSSVGAIAVVGFNVAREVPATAKSSSETSAADPSRSAQAGSAPSTSTPSPSVLSPTGSSPPVTTDSKGAPSPTLSTAALPPKDTGMSTGIKAGIGLGVSLGVLGIIALIFAIILLRRRSKNKPDNTSAVAPVTVQSEDKNIYGPGFYLGPPVYYGHGNGHGPRPQEVHSDPPTYELPSGLINSPVEIGYGRAA